MVAVCGGCFWHLLFRDSAAFAATTSGFIRTLWGQEKPWLIGEHAAS